MEFAKLSQKDYSKILKFYKVETSSDTYKRKDKRKVLAEKILANKLCKCIKTVNKYTNKRENSKRTRKQKKDMKQSQINAIRICRNSVITRKKLASFGYTCKNKPTLRRKKGKSYKLLKRM